LSETRFLTRLRTAAQVLRDTPEKPKNDFDTILEPNGDGELVPDPQASQRSWLPFPTYPTIGGLMLPYGGGADYGDSNNSFARAYTAVWAVRTCVDTYAYAIGQVPTRVIFNATYDRKNDKELARSDDVKPRHIWYEATRWHQRRLNIGLISAMLYNSMLTDAIYTLKVISEYNSSPRLQVLNSQGMTVEDSRGYVSRFYYSAAGGQRTYEPDVIAYNHGFNPFYDTRGASLVASIINKINIDQNLDTFLQAFFQNDAMPGQTVAPPDGTQWTDAQWEQIKAIFREQLTGVRNRRRTALFNQAVDVTNNDEPDISKHMSIEDPVVTAIFSAFGVPQALVGDNSATPYKDAPALMENFIRLRIKPIALDLQNYINDLCLPHLDKSRDVRFEFDFSALESADTTNVNLYEIGNAYVNNLNTLNEAREKMGDPPLEGGDRLSNGLTIEQIKAGAYVKPDGTIVVPEAQPTIPTAPTALPAAQTPALLPAQAEREETRSVTVMLGLANDASLVTLQQQVKSFMKGVQVEWNAPDTFHVTLIHLPDVDDGGLARLMSWCQSVDLPALALKVGSLNYFQGVGEYAVHFRIRQNPTLTDLQTNTADWLEGQGYSLSPYSQPSMYAPHITMGYAQDKPQRWTFDSKLSVQPQTLQLSYNGEIVYERDWPEASRHVHRHMEGVETWELDTPDSLHEAQLKELDQWATFLSARRGKPNTRTFEPNYLRGEKAERIRAAIEAAPPGEEMNVFRAIRQEMAMRDVQATRIQFEDAFDTAIKAALNGHMNRRQWGIEMRRIVLRGINAAYRDGLKAGGVDDEPDQAEQEKITELNLNQREYINNLSARLFKDEAVTPEMAEQRAQMWWGNSIQPAYYAGFESAAKNQMVEFVGDDGKESCPDCQRLKGQRHRLKDWTRKNMVPQQDGESYECGGWQCQHYLAAIEGRARGSW
jgi:HK97 family phage portal protein